MRKHDPIDSLIYISNYVGLHWAIDQISEINNEDVDVDTDAIIDALLEFEKSIKTELGIHYDGRRRYSTGVPFQRTEAYLSTEPDDVGREVPIIAEANVQIHPKGYPFEPLSPGGIWLTDDNDDHF